MDWQTLMCWALMIWIFIDYYPRLTRESIKVGANFFRLFIFLKPRFRMMIQKHSVLKAISDRASVSIRQCIGCMLQIEVMTPMISITIWAHHLMGIWESTWFFSIVKYLIIVKNYLVLKSLDDSNTLKCRWKNLMCPVCDAYPKADLERWWKHCEMWATK